MRAGSLAMKITTVLATIWASINFSAHALALEETRIDTPSTTLQSPNPQYLSKRYGPDGNGYGGWYGNMVCEKRFSKRKQILLPDQYPFWVWEEIWKEAKSQCLDRYMMQTTCMKTYSIYAPLTVVDQIRIKHFCDPMKRCVEYPMYANPAYPNLKAVFCIYDQQHSVLVIHPGEGEITDLHCAAARRMEVGKRSEVKLHPKLVLLAAETTTTGNKPLNVPEVHIEISTVGPNGPYTTYEPAYGKSLTSYGYLASVVVLWIRFCVRVKPWQLRQYPRIQLGISALFATSAQTISSIPLTIAHDSVMPHSEILNASDR